MGIRYYAYAFSADLAQRAIDDPHSILSSDPLADAWGLEPHASVSGLGASSPLHAAHTSVRS